MELVHDGPMLGGGDGDQVVDRPGPIADEATPDGPDRAAERGPCHHAPMEQGAVDELVELLDLENIEVNVFRGLSPEIDMQRVFGGQVAGQALVAAARTVDPTAPSTRCTPTSCAPATRGCRSSTRSTASATGAASPPAGWWPSSTAGRSSTCRRRSTSPSAGFDAPVRDARPTCRRRTSSRTSPPAGRPFKEQLGDWYTRPRPIDTRYADWTPPDRADPLPPRHRVWVRANGVLPDDPVLHACVLAYLSDMTLLDTTLLPHGGTFMNQRVQMASLDHAMWFHRPFRADEWLLYDQDTPSASDGRGLARGFFFTPGRRPRRVGRPGGPHPAGSKP